ncbi:hypothetical protein [Pseudophaeobacter sp.]|uniref:hypothetical protein n=1 Tax=Pseudophaeobacter sp. TaxID=1971739 RepID=UPI0032999A9C
MSFDTLLERMPHKGAMRLIERIISVSETEIHCLGVPHDKADYPLRLNGVLYTANLVELGAQAAAAHASTGELKGNHTGLLIGLQNVNLMTSTVIDCSDTLHITARQLHFDGNGALYDFEVGSQGQKCIEGRATLKMQGEAE